MSILLVRIYLRVRSLWQLAQNAALLTWSFTSRSGCADACGWWHDRQLICALQLGDVVGSGTSETGWPSVGCPRPYFSGSTTHLVLGEVVFGQFHAAVEDRDQVLGLELLRRCESGPWHSRHRSFRFLGAQQVIVLAAMRLMAGRASLLETPADADAPS